MFYVAVYVLIAQSGSNLPVKVICGALVSSYRYIFDVMRRKVPRGKYSEVPYSIQVCTLLLHQTMRNLDREKVTKR